MESISVFLDIANFLISGKKMLRPAELKVCDHHCRICVTDFREGGFPHSRAASNEAHAE